jgi:hypothetical protein
VLAPALLALIAPPAAIAAGTPTAAQIRTAVSGAEKSRYLWATVNICNTRRHRNMVGIRAQMPSLGFDAYLWMNVQLEYWSTARKRFVPVPGRLASRRLSLGHPTTGVHQAGVDFPISPHAGLLSGEVTFTWTHAGKVLGRVIRPATKGHRDADFSDPAHYSASTCAIR